MRHYKSLSFIETNCKQIQKETCLLKVLQWYMKNVELHLTITEYSPEIRTQKTEKYLKVWERKTTAKSLAHLLAW